MSAAFGEQQPLQALGPLCISKVRTPVSGRQAVGCSSDFNLCCSPAFFAYSTAGLYMLGLSQTMRGRAQHACRGHACLPVHPTAAPTCCIKVMCQCPGARTCAPVPVPPQASMHAGPRTFRATFRAQRDLRSLPLLKIAFNAVTLVRVCPGVDHAAKQPWPRRRSSLTWPTGGMLE